MFLFFHVRADCFIFSDSDANEAACKDHFAVKILAQELDLNHNCGYISMVNIGSDQSFKKREKASTRVKNSSGKKRRFKSLYGYSMRSYSTEPTQLTLNFSEGDPGHKTSIFKEEDWMLLDCSFGIPLFNVLLNEKVCQRLPQHQFCNRDR